MQTARGGQAGSAAARAVGPGEWAAAGHICACLIKSSALACREPASPGKAARPTREQRITPASPRTHGQGRPQSITSRCPAPPLASKQLPRQMCAPTCTPRHPPAVPTSLWGRVSRARRVGNGGPKCIPFYWHWLPPTLGSSGIRFMPACELCPLPPRFSQNGGITLPVPAKSWAPQQIVASPKK